MTLGKKAQFINYMSAIIVLVIFGFVSILIASIFLRFITAFQAAGLYTGEAAAVGDAFLATFRGYDWLIVFLLLGLVIGVIVSTFKVATRPVFFIITFIATPFFGLISFFFNFIFSNMISAEVFSATLVYFPRTLLICTNLHWVFLLNVVIGSITLYAKRSKGQSEFLS